MFIDETGANTKMARRHGRAPRGQRLRASVPHGHWKTTTFIGGLRLSGMTAPMVLDGPMTGAWFLAYVEQLLVPTLQPGEIVILDNLAAHKNAAARRAIEAVGASLLFLPAYGELAAMHLEHFPISLHHILRRRSSWRIRWV